MHDKPSTIAIIDSGIGGISILNRLIKKFNCGNYIYFADNLYMPYGNKTCEFLSKRLDYIINLLFNDYKVDLIIVACNTASSVIDKQKYNNIITMTFANDKTYFATALTKKNLKNINVIADNSLASLIEQNIFDTPKLNEIISKHIKKHKLDKLSSFVLGCTHYELVKDIFVNKCKNVNVESNIDFVIDKINVEKCNNLSVIFLQSKFSLCYNEKMQKLIGR